MNISFRKGVVLSAVLIGVMSGLTAVAVTPTTGGSATSTGGKASPILIVMLTPTGSVAVGTSVYAKTTMSSTATAGVTGTVTYTVYKDSACQTVAQTFPAVTISAGNVPSSPSFTYTVAGTYYYVASYSGDANNLAAKSGCPSAPLTVTPNTSTASKLIFTTVPPSTNTGIFSGMFFVQRVDTTGTPITSGGQITVALSSDSANGTFNPTSVVIASGQSTSAAFSYKSTTAGTFTIKASSGTLTTATTPYTVNNSNPTISIISPSFTSVGLGVPSFIIYGGNFLSGATIKFGSGTLTASSITSTQIVASIPSAMVTKLGPITVTVTNPGNPVASNPVTFTVNNPSPVVTSVTPSVVTVGSGAFTFLVNGTGFVSGSTIQLNGLNLTTTPISATQLKLTSQLIPTTPLIYSVTVSNPGPCVGSCTSNNDKTLIINAGMGTIHFVKNTIGASVGTFGFSTGGFSLNQNPLTTAALTTTTGQAVRDITVPAGTGLYSISENASPPGWAFTSASCTFPNGTLAGTTTGASVVAITVNANTITTCKFVNTYTPVNNTGSIKVVTTTIGMLQNPLQVFQFNPVGFQLQNALNQISVTTSTGTSSATDLRSGIAIGSNPSISEVVPAGWTLGQPICRRFDNTPTGNLINNNTGIGNIIIDPNQVTTCTFTNTAKPINPKMGTIRFVKNTIGASVGTFNFITGGFQLNQNPLTTAGGTAVQNINVPVANGVYSISENTLDPGWTFTSADCKFPNGTLAGTTSGSSVTSISVNADTTTTCTFVNTFKPGNTLSVSSSGVTGVVISSSNNNAWGGTANYTKPNIAAGTLVSLSAPATFGGFNFSNWVGCDSVTTTTCSITMSAGKAVTAVYVAPNNTGSIKVVKNTIGMLQNPLQVFQFNPVGFQLQNALNQISVTTSLGAGSGQDVRSGIAVGSNYSLGETQSSGWTLGQPLPSCTREGGLATGTYNSTTGLIQSIAVEAGKVTTCTFNNVAESMNSNSFINVVKTAVGGDGVFKFDVKDTSTSPTVSSSFSITTQGGTGSYLLSVPANKAYPFITETALPAGFKLTSVACFDSNNQPLCTSANDAQGNPTCIKFTHQAVAGQTVTCKFTNTSNTLPQQGKLVVNKIANNADAQFTFFVKPGPTSFTVTTSGGKGSQSMLLDAGTYSIDESIPQGWQLDSAGCDNGTIGTFKIVAGQTTTCTFTNTKPTNPVLGWLKVTKGTLAGTGDDTFNFGITGPSALNQGVTTLGNNSSTNGSGSFTVPVKPGKYTISETVKNGWGFVSASCSDGTAGSAGINGVAGVTVAAGQTTFCLFTNTKASSISVTKKTIGGEGTFSFTSTIPNHATFTIKTTNGAGTFSASDIVPGKYSVTESLPLPAGWEKIDDTCANVIVNAGQTASCAITNKFTPTTTGKGSLLVNKISNNGDGQYCFNLFGGTTGGFCINTTNGKGSYFANNLTPGTYTATESPSQGSTQDSTTCDNVKVVANQTATCTVTNTITASKKLELISIDPNSKKECDSSFTMTLTGTGFESGAIAMLGSIVLNTHVKSTTELTAEFTTPLPGAANSPYYITVVNPAPDSETSNAKTFTVDSCDTNNKDPRGTGDGNGDIPNNGLPLRQSF